MHRSALTWVVSSLLCPTLSHAAGAQAESLSSTALEEVVVTASKTGEDVRDIVGSVSALTAHELSALGAQSSADYLSRVPGVVFNAAGPGYSTITIRGVNTTTGFAQLSQATTGVYINDVPLTDPFFSAGTPDIDTYDVDHVEIHRGPQGTLFGSSSLGGAVNYIAREAELDTFDVGAETTQSVTDHSGDWNSTYKMRVNVPLVKDELAIRFVAARRYEQGYLDNIGRGVENANDGVVEGGRLVAAWEPAPQTRVTWMSLYQQTRLDDAFYQDPSLGELKFSSAFPERSKADVLIHSLSLKQGFGFADLTMLAGYHEKTGFTTADLTSRFGFAGLVPFTSIEDSVKTDGYTFEARLASPREATFTWLIGTMYNRTDEDILEFARAPGASTAIDALFGSGLGDLLTRGDAFSGSVADFTGEEAALFGEGSYALTDRWKLTAGGRLFRTQIDSGFDGFGLIIFAGSGAPVFQQAVEQREDGFNPKLAISYSFRPDAQIYALASKGFRFGGTNVNPGAPRLTFDSDSLWNYEVGLKSESSEAGLRIDASAFRIDWSDIQLVLVDPLTGGSFTGNAGDATIDGAELAIAWRASSNVELSTNATWLDARLVQDFNPGFGPIAPKGSTLPGASEWQVASSLRLYWQTAGAPFLSVSHRYASSAPGVLQKPSVKTGDYHVFDLRAGISFSRARITLFASNLTDERAVTAATFFSQPSALETHEYVMRPRTFGITVAWDL